MKSLILPESLRSDLKNPLGLLCKGEGRKCISDMATELKAARKIVAVGDMTAFYLLEASMMPDIAIVDNKTKRLPAPDHVLNRLQIDSYKTIKVRNPPATLTKELMDLIKDSMNREERLKLVVEGEEDLATLPAILYAPLGAVVIYGQPEEGSVLVRVTNEKKEQIKNIMDNMIVEE
ncbi:MAG: GTP-dependent dephospho-CoA kinase family protein [Methanotrichaceae archaeon]|nr:GTP-dependent dephospho-CoA kinase family protein [Methanotrichaceae archaeon]